MTEPSRGFLTHLSGTCDVTGQASLGHGAPAVAGASPHHGGSGLPERVLWWRLTSLYDGRSLRSHTVSLLLSLLMEAFIAPRFKGGHMGPTSQWEAYQRLCSHI